MISGPLHGMQVIRDHRMPPPWSWEQVRFPRSRRRRIRKKWSARQANYGRVGREPTFYHTVDAVMGHPECIELLLAAVSADEGAA